MTRTTADWNDRQRLQPEWLDEQARMERMLAPFTDVILEAAHLAPGDSVLDVGCGTGATTAAAWDAVQPGGAVTGVDVSIPMLEAARRRLPPAVKLIWADAALHSFATGEFHAAISRFGIGHFLNVADGFAHLFDALVEGGQLTFVEWAISKPNEWLTLVPDVARRVLGDAAGTRTPEHAQEFADGAELRRALIATGATKVSVELVTEQLWVGSDADDVMGWFGRLPDSQFLEALTALDRLRFLEALHHELVRRQTPAGVHLIGTAWLVQARRP